MGSSDTNLVLWEVYVVHLHWFLVITPPLFLTERDCPMPLKQELLKYFQNRLDPKPYMFLFHVYWGIKQYVRHDFKGQSCSPETRSAQMLLKLLRSPPLNYIYSCSLCNLATNSIQVMTVLHVLTLLTQALVSYMRSINYIHKDSFFR